MPQTEEKIKDTDTKSLDTKLNNIESDISDVKSFFENAEDLKRTPDEEIQPFKEGLSEFAELLDTKAESQKSEIDNSFTVNENDETNQEIAANFTDLIEDDDIVTDFDEPIDDSKLDPFETIFDTEDIVNIAKSANYIIEDLEKKQAELDAINKIESYFVPKKQLEYLLQDTNITFFTKDETGNISQIDKSDIDVVNNLDGLHEDELIEISVPVGKKKDEYKVEQDDYEYSDDYNDYTTQSENEKTDDIYHTQLHEFDDDYTEEDYEKAEKERLFKEEMRAKLGGLKKIVESLIEKDDYQDPEEVFSNYLQENFKDYLLAKKITGSSQVRFSDKLIPEELISQSEKSIEIVELDQESRQQPKKTSILINRDVDAEIESIEILCKCGEKTIIKFEEDAVKYEEALDDDEQELVVSSKMGTEIIIDTLDLESLNLKEAMEASKEKNNMSVPEDISSIIYDESAEEDEKEEEEDIEEKDEEDKDIT